MSKVKSKSDADKPKKKKTSSQTSKDMELSNAKVKKKKKKIKTALSKTIVPKPEELQVIKETAAEKYQRELREEQEKESREKRALRQLQFMKRKDTQRECILRGLNFKDVAGFSTPQLAGWFTDHLDDGQDPNLLPLYDAHVHAILLARGHMDEDQALTHPSLKFGIVGNSKDWDDKGLKNSTKPPRESKAVIIKAPREKNNREKDDTHGGIYTGTKKHMTYELTKAGKKIDDIIKLVTAQFPEANEASIKIWNKRALKEM